MSAQNLPKPVIQRLPKYLTHVQELITEGLTWASSSEIARALGLTSSTVRQDLSHLDLTGVSKRGYSTERLEAALVKELRADTQSRVVIIGAGFLGSALALHGDLAKQGFNACGIFDVDPNIIGTNVGELTVQSMQELPGVVKEQNIDIGIISVPPEAAQTVGDQLVEAGIKGVLNLAHAHVNVPEHIAIVDARILARLRELAYAIRTLNEARLAEKPS